MTVSDFAQYAGYGQALLALGVTIMGMCCHWLKKWLRDQTDVDFIDYIVAVNPGATISAVVSSIGTVMLMMSTGQIDPSSAVGVATLFATGYTFDSAVNSDRRKK